MIAKCLLYKLQELFKVLQEEYKDENEKCTVELKYSALIGWEDMKCMQMQLKRDPALYTCMIGLI